MLRARTLIAGSMLLGLLLCMPAASALPPPPECTWGVEDVTVDRVTVDFRDGSPVCTVWVTCDGGPVTRCLEE